MRECCQKVYLEYIVACNERFINDDSHSSVTRLTRAGVEEGRSHPTPRSPKTYRYLWCWWMAPDL